VTRDVAPKAIVAGVPARDISERVRMTQAKLLESIEGIGP
jgi:acetyltransferase-like isoleucine patch superfamily enzyme